MKYLLILVAIFTALATALAYPDTHNTTYAAASGSSSADDVPALPPQPVGESLSNFLDQLFPSNTTENSFTETNSTGAKHKRDTTLVTPVTVGPYLNSYGLHQSFWDEETDSGKVSYNISVDFSSCSTGIKLNTDIGVYTFTNGTTNNNTNFSDMVADIYSLRHSRQSPNPNYASHTADVAQLAMDEAIQVLNNGLICPNQSNTAVAPILDRTELRHLLANKHSYWTTVILSSLGGASMGAIIATVADKVFLGNVSAENVVQTAIVIGCVVIIGGILGRCDQVGRLDRAEDVAHRARELVPQGREAIVQNTYIAWARRTLARLARQQATVAAVQMAEMASSAGGSAAGSVPGSPSTPGTCLSELEAGEAASAIEMMQDVASNLETIEEAVEQMGPRDEQGACSSV
ncbi:hypothetical protein BDR22DRAFT_860247 [Usnea florida]